MTTKPAALAHQPFGRRQLLPAILGGLFLFGASLGQVGAQPAPAGEPAPAPGQLPGGFEQPAPETLPQPFVPTHLYTFKEMGAQYPMNLRGVDASNSLPFTVRADEVATAVRLDLRYAYSPSLISELSQINVLINDELATSIPVPRETGGQSLQHQIDLPAYLLSAQNQLRLQLIGHYTMDCEDPLHSSLWANISNHSTLSLQTTRIALPDDLAMLPLPFFDARDKAMLTLPFVFGGNPDTATLEAAGALSSWFGALADHRRADFPVALGAVPPQGHAVVLISDPAQAAAYGQPAVNGPTVALAANPSDPEGKLLLVMGRNSAELKQAAQAVASGNKTLTGPSATITQLEQRQPRVPYDAPRWLRSDRPVTFGELIATQRLSVSGYSPETIRMDLRVAPDLFGWRAKPVPVELKYRYTPQPTSVNSALLFSVDDFFVKSMPLFALERLEDGETLRKQVLPDESLPMQTRLDVPLELLKARSQLQFRYMYDYIKQGECRDIIIDNVRGAIEPESTIDVSSYPHFMAMPNLSAFAETGFPFTRLADLSETTVLIGANAGAADYSAYLNVMGRMGESTGYPALGVTVAPAAQAAQHGGKDLLVIASGEQQPLLSEWASHMPAGYAGSGRSFGTSDLVYRVLGWFNADPRDDTERARTSIAYTSSGVNAIIAGFESPLTAQRSVVVISSNQPDGLHDAVGALRNDEAYEGPIQGSLAIVRGKQIDSLVADHTYTVGQLGFFKRIDWWLSSVLPGASLLKLLVGGLIALVLLGLAIGLLRSVLRRRKPKH